MFLKTYLYSGLNSPINRSLTASKLATTHFVSYNKERNNVVEMRKEDLPMAKESFDKEIQLLRMLVLTSGAYNRSGYAKRLGISVHTLDKTLRRLKDIIETTYQPSSEEDTDSFDSALSYNYYDSSDPLLLFLFRAKSVKQSEIQRLSILLAALNEDSRTVIELLELTSSMMAQETTLPDEKTIRSDLKYLESVGVISKVGSQRPYRYKLNNDLITNLSNDELLDLYDYIDVMSNTHVPSVPGYLLRDGLKKQLSLVDLNHDVFLYKYHYYSRILDEAHLFSLLSAIQSHRHITFMYFSPKKETSYASQNSNPRFQKPSAGSTQTTLPLKVVYDHQYGRWYLIGSGREGIRKYRMEGMTGITEAHEANEDVFNAKLNSLEEALRYSWLIDTGATVKVRAFFYTPIGAPVNFVKERVLLQGQWGEIVEENDDGFIYEIDVNGITEIKPWLRSFGSSCEVLEPRSLRQDLIQEWKEIKTYYEPI